MKKSVSAKIMKNIILIFCLVFISLDSSASVSFVVKDSLPAWQAFKKMKKQDLLELYKNDDTALVIVRTIIARRKENIAGIMVSSFLLAGSLVLLASINPYSAWADGFYIAFGVIAGIIFLVFLIPFCNLFFYNKKKMYRILKKYKEGNMLPYWVFKELRFYKNQRK